jgi:hypothetical protein
MSPNSEYTDYSEDGVDMTLIRWMLALTPAERLAVAQDCANFVLETRRLNGVPELSEDS